MPEKPREPWDEALRANRAAPHWRALAELSDPEAFGEAARGEFPPGVDREDPSVTRRVFLELLGASVALAGLSGCTRAPHDKIVPYASQPREVTPGVPSFYATAMVLDGYATGLLAESHEGRPTKLEGNPEHPASLGAAGVFEQAWVLGLYDPNRARALREGETPRSVRALAEFLARAAGARGAGLSVLLEPQSSPLMADLLARARARLPEARFHFHAPLARTEAWRGARAVFGRPLEAQYDLRRADVVVALDADLLAQGPFALRHARHFAERRRVRGPADAMNRLYAVEAAPTVTGATADHRLRVARREVRAVAMALLAEVLRSASPAPAAPADLLALLSRTPLAPERARWVAAVARDLRAHAGAGLVVAGDGQPWEVHALAHLANAALGNAGRTVRYTEPPVLEAGEPSHDLGLLAQDLAAGRVQTLLVLEGNPAYGAPADLDFPRRMREARERLYLAPHENETALASTWVVPAAHGLESWGDARAADGTVSFAQPLIAPLYDGHTPAEILALLLGEPDPRAYTLLRAHWRTAMGTSDFEPAWERAVQRGFLPDTALALLEVQPDWAAVTTQLAGLPPAPEARGLELGFAPDAKVYDGRFANNAWLQELPDPLSKLTWDNAALVSPATAAREGLSTDEVVEIAYRGRRVRAPVLVLPGHADDCVTLALGYGRQGGEALARGVGANAFALRTSDAPCFGTGATLTRLTELALPVRRPLALTQTHWSLEGRPLAPAATLEQYRRAAQTPPEPRRRLPTLYELRPSAPVQWGMAIDLGVCTGCSACVVACQAENNVPVVGREGVAMSREMHWLRIDRYFSGDLREPRVAVQPMLCQHCEKAPCEYVCPVNATVHSPDGLNEQVYNRCIGTRFCSNNCPYKVRRFNWFDYRRDQPEVVELAMNPDVTVRARGVMEKCTYCVQRIREAEIAAHVAGRTVRDGDVKTACQQACPTGAIAFGLVSDAGSPVARDSANERAYAVLDELGTEPRTRYLARLTNPNPELEAP